MMIWAIVYLITPGAAKEGFKNEQHFTSYVNNLGLSSLDKEQAAARLKALNFKCASDNSYCVREIGQFICMQEGKVKLSTDKDNKLSIATQLDHTCV